MGCRAVEVTGGHEDAEVGQAIHEGPRVARVRGVRDPQVQACRRVGVDVEAGVSQRLEEECTTHGVDTALALHVLGVVQSDRHRVLDGGGHHESRVLAHADDRGDQRRIAIDEGAAVAREIRLLGQRVQDEESARIAVAHVRIEQGGHSLADVGLRPGQGRVALVGDNDGTVGARPGDDGAQLVLAHDVPVGVARRVQVDEGGLGPGVGLRRVHGDGGGTGQPGTDVVGRVGDLGHEDRVAGAHAQQGGDPGDGLLRADRGDHAGVADVDHAPSLSPCEDRVAHLDGADHRRVAVRVGCLGESLTDERGGVIDRGSDAQIAHSPGMFSGARLGGRQLIPGEFRQIKRAGKDRCHTPTLSTVRGFRPSIPHSEAAARRSSDRRSPGRRSSGRRRGCPGR